MAHTHPVYDTDYHFHIDPITRVITNTESLKTTLMQYDHNSERFSFELERYIEGHDMSLCNKVEIHYLNTNSATREKNAGVYEVTDFDVSDDEETMIFSWLISENATIHQGTLAFLITFACVEEDDAVTYRWNSGIHNAIKIDQGMNNEPVIIDAYPDILWQWKEDLYGRNYAYEGAVAQGFEGTEEEWYEFILAYETEQLIWRSKQNKLGWVTNSDIDAMFDGLYVGSEDESEEEYYQSFEVIDENLIITMKEKEVE